MNKLVRVVLTISLVTKTSQLVENTTANIIKVDLFSNLNRQLHSVSGTIFRSLRLGRNFTNTNKINMLIKMADDLIKLSERKFKMYRDVDNATKMGCDKHQSNTAINPLFNLTQVIEEIFKEEHYFLRNNIFLRNNSLIEFYEGVISNSDWLEKSVIDWENAENKTDIKYRRRIPVKNLRRKHQNTLNALISRRRMDDLLPWRAPNETKRQTRRIYGSEPATIKKYPFVASLLLMGEFVCAASIISKNMVLTAASCLQLAYKNPNFLDKRDAVAVRVGSDYPNKGGEVEPITAVYFHSKYDPVYLYNNLAIGRMEKSLKFLSAKSSVRRIEYDRDHREMVDRTGIIILGWGDQNNYNSYNGPLTMARLETYNLETCKKIYSDQYVTKTDFCAGFVEQGTGACHRDVGGPGFIGSQLVGIVNFGPPVCGTLNGPTVFTKIGNHAAWINSVIAKFSSKSNKTVAIKTIASESEEKKQQNTKRTNKESIIQNSALDLLRTIFKGLRLDALLNNNFDTDEQPVDDDFFETNKKSVNLADLKDGLYPDDDEDFFATTTHSNDLVSKIKSSNFDFTTKTTTTKTTSVPEHTQSELGDLLTIPQNTDDIDPDLVKQFKEIKQILEPIFATTTRPMLKTKRHGRTTTAIPKTKMNEKPAVTLRLVKPHRHKQMTRVTDTMPTPTTEIKEIYDNNSDKNENEEYSEADKLKQQKIFKNWDVSTNEEMSKTDSDDDKYYEKRRLKGIIATGKNRHREKFNMRQQSSSEIDRPDFKLSKALVNQTGDKIQAMILTAVNTDARDRDLAHYHESEEENWDDEQTRRLLDYVNI